MKECCLARRKNPRSEIYQTKAHYEFTYLYYLMKHKKLQVLWSPQGQNQHFSAIYTLQQKKRMLFNIHLIPETLIKFYPK